MTHENTQNGEGLINLLLPSLAVVFGLQMLRAFIPGLAWYLRDTIGASTMSLIPYALGTFFVGFLTALLVRLIGIKTSLWISGGGLGILRLVEQLVKDPGVDFWLAIAGVGTFLIFLTTYLGWSRAKGSAFQPIFYLGIISGFALDITLRGVFGLRELREIDGWLPFLLTALGTAAILWGIWREGPPESQRGSEGNCRSVSLLLAIGPFFLLQMLYTQNTGWVEEVSGLPFPAGFLIICLGYIAAAGGACLGFARPRSLHPSLVLGSGFLLTYGIYYADQLGAASLALILGGQFILGWGLGGIGRANQEAPHKSLWRTTLALTGGMVLFLLLSFAYYVAQDIALPFSRASFPALAAGIIAALVFWASFQVWKKTPRDWEPAGLISTGMMVLVPIICWIAWSPGPGRIQPPGTPVRVMNYNIHSAYNVAGSQDLEAIASVIENAGVEIIGLQEISRTRLMDGSPDMPTWLARRLGMEMVFAGTEEPIWGNAILSRYPILESGYQPLPREGSLIGRGFLWARIDVGEEAPLLVVVTHLHHIVADGHVRLVQVPEILAFLEGKEQAVLLGDFNAKPDSPEIGLIYEAGLVDAWLEAGEGPGYTDASNNPVKRIDYLWHSPDLIVKEIDVIQTTASDHMPVVGSIEKKN